MPSHKVVSKKQQSANRFVQRTATQQKKRAEKQEVRKEPWSLASLFCIS